MSLNVFVCSVCKESFHSSDAIACHILNNHVCDATVKKLRRKLSPKRKTKVKSHELKGGRVGEYTYKNIEVKGPKIRNHRIEYYCDQCNYKTVYRSTYKRHLLTHERGSRTHKCIYCSYAAIQPNNLKIHIKTVHPFGGVDPVFYTS